jgi:hypothetical protein
MEYPVFLDGPSTLQWAQSIIHLTDEADADHIALLVSSSGMIQGLILSQDTYLFWSKTACPEYGIFGLIKINRATSASPSSYQLGEARFGGANDPLAPPSYDLVPCRVSER